MRYRKVGNKDVSVIALGAMLMGSRTDEDTSFAILDRFVEAGGTFIDTSNNYAFWVDGGTGGQSEQLLGRWRRSRGVGDELVIATKVGARPTAPGLSYVDAAEGLSAKVIREQAEISRERLGVEKIDLYYSHIEDRSVELEETVRAFGELVQDGVVGMLGASNHPIWRVERARQIAQGLGLAGYEVLQYQHSYLRPRFDVPESIFRDGSLGHAGAELLSYLRLDPAMTLVAYSPLLTGAYTRADKKIPYDYEHPGTPKRLAVLKEIAEETGATANQVVLSWQLGHELAIVPLVGASSVAQLDETLGALDLELTEDQRARLDAVN
ncbi:MAG: aldo/keto reductase [Thermoactinospora sp.]|nr:aldo/keto reductase [Thermoactinospora sp.]